MSKPAHAHPFPLILALADAAWLRWAQEQVTAHHYLHHPVDVRCRPLAYLIWHEGRPLGCLIFGRPEATRGYGWYGSIEDTQREQGDPRYCPLTRWQVLNLFRVWLHPDLQAGGACHVPNAASWAIGAALRRVGYDYLIARPVCFLDEPYEIRTCLSYCNRQIHHGTLYRAANFRLVRTNTDGIETYARDLRRLTHAEHAEIARTSAADARARRLRAARTVMQPSLFV